LPSLVTAVYRPFYTIVYLRRNGAQSRVLAILRLVFLPLERMSLKSIDDDLAKTLSEKTI
jgi:hypothetical protein